MASITVKHIIDIVAGILQDESTTESDRSWSEESLVNYYNIVGRRIVGIASHANPKTESVKLAAGTKQSIPAAGIAFLNAIRNMGTSPGETPGMAITPTLMSVIASYDLNWSTKTPQETIWNVFSDLDDRTIYYNYPPSDGTGYILLEYSKIPVSIVWDEDGNWETALVEVKEQCVNAFIPGILAMTYEKDTDFPGNIERAQGYEAQFINEMSQI